jgi:nitrogen regulatory protein PII
VRRGGDPDYGRIRRSAVAACRRGVLRGGEYPVKLITAVVKPERLDDVTRAVTEAGARGMTVTEVRGFGQQYGHMAAVQPGDREILMLPKLRIDVVVAEKVAVPVADAIAKAVNTGTIGDGKIWVSALDSVLRVRTGERDTDAA